MNIQSTTVLYTHGTICCAANATTTTLSNEHTAHVHSTNPTARKSFFRQRHTNATTTATAGTPTTTTTNSRRNTSQPHTKLNRNYIKPKVNTDSIIYINARSVICNLAKIELMCSNLKPKVVCCSEARVNKEIENEIKIEGYNEVICHSKNRHTGGVVMYIQKGIKFKVIHSVVVDDTIWALAIEILECKLNGIYVCFYRSNKAKSHSFDDNFEDLLNNAIKQSKLVLCMGDLNINMMEITNKTQQFINLYERYDLKSISNFATRITNDSETEIDIVLTNKRENIQCETVIGERVRDHETIQIKISNERTKIDYNKKSTVLSWKKYTKEQLIENLRECPWTDFEEKNLDEKIL